MPLVTDIPERDGLDGATQLALLRSYLKDLETPYLFTDDLLITLLVSNERVTVWRNITGEAATSIPWSYDPTSIQEPINRVRLLTGDTVEASLRYTDAELWRLLDVIPLRYVVLMLNAEQAGGNTLPEDRENPITILRLYLGDDDVTSVTHTDAELVQLLITSGKSPYGYIFGNVDATNGIKSSLELSSTGGELASLDGISFSSPSESMSQKESQKDDIASAYLNSPYWKEDISAWYVDGINMTERDWEVRWYAIR